MMTSYCNIFKIELHYTLLYFLINQIYVTKFFVKQRYLILIFLHAALL
jgi:hypothetical protein